jgi:hypothetical protein
MTIESSPEVFEVRKSHIQFGTSAWKADKEHASDYRDGFREFSPAELKNIRGIKAADVQKDLRAVHWRHGFDASHWESEAAARSRSVGAQQVPARASQNQQKTQFKLGISRVEYISDARDGHRSFSQTELDAAKGVMSESARKELRAVHIFAPRGKSAWSSEATNIGKGANNCVAPERHTKDMRSSNIYFGAERLGYISDAKDALRGFSTRDMNNARGAMSDDAKKRFTSGALHLWY